jgi:ABC transporter substrate binding protein
MGPYRLSEMSRKAKHIFSRLSSYGRISLAIPVFCFVLLHAASLLGKDTGHIVTVFLSRNIRPYIEAAEGFREMLGREGFEINVLFLDDGIDSDAMLPFGMNEGSWKQPIVTIGPEALDLFQQKDIKQDISLFYMMVLNPDEILEQGTDSCGVSLNIPPELQVDTIFKTMPEVKRVGLLYDPKNNSEFFFSATAAGKLEGISIEPLSVSTRTEITRVLKNSWTVIDALWLIPDQTVISESIVRYIIKEALLNNRPVVGYNRFFYEAGAAVSFVFDYRAIGQQAAMEFVQFDRDRECLEVPPAFKGWINAKVLKKIGYAVPKIINETIILGP